MECALSGRLLMKYLAQWVADGENAWGIMCHWQCSCTLETSPQSRGKAAVNKKEISLNDSRSDRWISRFAVELEGTE